MVYMAWEEAQRVKDSIVPLGCIVPLAGSESVGSYSISLYILNLEVILGNMFY
jgi:hypothetical protein